MPDGRSRETAYHPGARDLGYLGAVSQYPGGFNFLTIIRALRLCKPYRSADLVHSLAIVAGIVATGIASPPFPRGFQLLPPATTVRPELSYG